MSNTPSSTQDDPRLPTKIDINYGEVVNFSDIGYKVNEVIDYLAKRDDDTNVSISAQSPCPAPFSTDRPIDHKHLWSGVGKDAYCLGCLEPAHSDIPSPKVSPSAPQEGVLEESIILKHPYTKTSTVEIDGGKSEKYIPTYVPTEGVLEGELDKQLDTALDGLVSFVVAYPDDTSVTNLKVVNRMAIKKLFNKALMAKLEELKGQAEPYELTREYSSPEDYEASKSPEFAVPVSAIDQIIEELK